MCLKSFCVVVGQQITLSLPTGVEVWLGCDNILMKFDEFIQLGYPTLVSLAYLPNYPSGTALKQPVKDGGAEYINSDRCWHKGQQEQS